MLRPEKMGRVSVTGSKAVLEDVVETAHDLNLLHLTEYDGSWEGFEPGNPTEGADRASDALVTVRSLESILGVDESDAETRPVLPDDLHAEIEAVREQVNELDDRQDELGDELRSVEEQLDSVRPFVELGIDLDLLGGYDNLSVAVGEGDEAAVREALVDQPGVDSHEILTADDGEALAVFAYPAVDISDALVSAQFTAYEVPDLGEDGESVSPEQYVQRLEQRKRELESQLSTVEDQLDDLRVEVGGFLLAAEERLAVQVQKTEAPLSFATTENAFVAEGWLPYDEYVALAEGLQEAVGDHVDVDLLEVAEYNDDGHPTDSEDVPGGAAGGGVGEPTAADGGETVADGGTATVTEADEVATDGAGADVAMSHSTPPVIQDNPGPVKPFEALTEVINRPKYDELDPSVILFLTFPVFFGFMIGDLGYGLLYMGLGYLLISKFDSDIIRSLGGVGLLAGLFTGIFGILYGEFFGLHQLGEIVWPSGSPPMHKGLIPEYGNYALGWLVVSLLAGVLHLTVGWIFDFYQNLSHGFKDAMLESGSWLMMMFGLWAWIFSGANGSAPDLLVAPEAAVFNGNPFPFGFAGLPAYNLFEIPALGAPFSVWLLPFLLGFVLLVAGEPIEGVEFLNVLVNVLSYTRLAAVLLAKAGMAFVVNLLFFGVWVTETESGAAWHFGIDHSPQYYLEQGTYHGNEVTSVLFGGLAHGGIAAVLGGIVVLVLGHLLVLALGITSAGLQAVRLEYVEFFGKFYEGGGDEYEPFGYETRFAGDD
jgi:V/A-type H+-transporting ATPase subunit I